MIKTTEIMRKDWLYYKGKMNAFPFQVEQVTKKKIGYHANRLIRGCITSDLMSTSPFP